MKAITEFIVDYNIKILNVAGHRSAPRCHAFIEKVKSLLHSVFEDVRT